MMLRRFVFLFFIPLCLSVKAQNADLRLLEFINTPPAKADKTWRLVTGSVTYVSLAAPVSMLVTGLVEDDPKLTEKAITTGAALALDGLSTLALKAIIKRDRPFVSYPNLIVAKTGAGGYSLPSGHTSLAFATATSLSLAFPKWYVIAPSFAYASLIGYSRMYLGVHYPSDVLAGAVVGAGSAYLSSRAQHWLDRRATRRHHANTGQAIQMN